MGITSVTINLEARSYNVYTKSENIVCDTEIKFVRIDEEGAPIPIKLVCRIHFFVMFFKNFFY